MARVSDPLIETEVGGRRMVMPLSHDLPETLAAHPSYAGNLARLTAMLDGPVIDIGANVGDTVALLRAVTDAPLLAVEGDKTFLPLLRANVAGITDVEIEACYVASDLSAGAVTATRQHGTASLMPSAAGDGLPFRSLTAIVEDHPRFAEARLLKIDTDGADAAIIAGNVDWLTGVLPVVFLEYDALWAAHLRDREPWRAFAALADAGYRRAVVWVNTGELLLTGDVADAELWRDLGRYSANPRRLHYFDVAAFPEENPIAEGFIADERRAALP